jgi:hypothetical protein
MSYETPDRARQLARELELRFAQDTELACRLNDAHDRLKRANDRLWRGMHPDGIAAVYGERPTAGSTAFAKNRSEVLAAPDPLQAIQQIHWQILLLPARRGGSPPTRGRNRRDHPHLSRRAHGGWLV